MVVTSGARRGLPEAGSRSGEVTSAVDKRGTGVVPVRVRCRPARSTSGAVGGGAGGARSGRGRGETGGHARPAAAGSPRRAKIVRSVLALALVAAFWPLVAPGRFRPRASRCHSPCSLVVPNLTLVLVVVPGPRGTRRALAGVVGLRLLLGYFLDGRLLGGRCSGCQRVRGDANLPWSHTPPSESIDPRATSGC